jgi:hypothetical protein
MNTNDAKYLEVVLNPIRVCKEYRPKFGQRASGGGLTLEQFRTLYQSDSFYSWFGLDNPLMYAAHKAAGGMTSVYRQIGIGCEKLFRRVLMESLDLEPKDVVWSYETPTADGGTRVLTLDGRVPLDRIQDKEKRERFHGWMEASARRIGVEHATFNAITGAIFEVRQGYKSKDSKRQNADIANAATAYAKGYLPCAAVLSNQIDEDVLIRYRARRWAVVTGIDGLDDPVLSTYDFMRDVVGYDLAAFFTRNSAMLRREIEEVLEALLTPETT